MVSVTNYGHGFWCYRCQEVQDSTDECDHFLSDKAGIEEVFGEDHYAAQPNDMGHHSPHTYIEIDGMDQCADCDRVKIPAEFVENEVTH